jgi:fumarylacetoacetase
MTGLPLGVEPECWLPIPEDSDFPIANLPYGAFHRSGGEPARIGVAIGDYVLDLTEASQCGLFDDAVAGARVLFSGPDLNPFLTAGPAVWQRTRDRLIGLLDLGDTEIQDASLGDQVLVKRERVKMALPVAVGDYVDFYSSLEHATNLGRIFRPDGEPLAANWRHLPVGYHGRAGSVVLSGTPITRPHGQRGPQGSSDLPTFGPTERLDIELELAFVTGNGKPLGQPIRAEEAEDTIFGFVLLNDWSARDIQAWEYVPLGPFLGKSFATSISPWVVPLEALKPYRRPAPQQVPPPLPHLRTAGEWGLDIELSVELRTAADRAEDRAGTTIASTNAAGLYWTAPQQLAHASSNGARVRAGDLFASGTISGSGPAEAGSLIELTWNGATPIVVTDGEERTFLEDGDEVTIRGHASAPERPRIGFGEVTGRVVPADAADNKPQTPAAPTAALFTREAA